MNQKLNKKNCETKNRLSKVKFKFNYYKIKQKIVKQ